MKFGFSLFHEEILWAGTMPLAVLGTRAGACLQKVAANQAARFCGVL